MKIEHIETGKLRVHDRNPRKIDDAQFEILKRSITENPEYFEVRPILCTPDFTVFAGNMRLRAALALGLKTVPVAIFDISDEKLRELMIRDNVSNGSWDADVLSADFELGELQSWGYDPVAFGFKSDFKPTGADTKLDEAEQWVYTCPECGAKKIFTKADLKKYDPNDPDTAS